MALRAREAFSVDDRGIVRVFTPGSLVNEKDPIVKGREHLFEPVEAVIARHREVEHATAAPGEKRALSTGRRGGRRRAQDEKPAEVVAEETTGDDGPDAG